MDNALAHHRAVSGNSPMNESRIISAFVQRGIPEQEIIPRVNVFTYRAWQHEKRQVRKGEKGVKVITFIEDRKTKQKRPKSAHVFHISQTVELLETPSGQKYRKFEG